MLTSALRMIVEVGMNWKTEYMQESAKQIGGVIEKEEKKKEKSRLRFKAARSKNKSEKEHER